VVNDFLETINNETLGQRVAIALKQRQQSQLDKAMRTLSETNRDQVLAIREIQAILDRSAGRSGTQVVFEKYHQTLSFQIGLTNGQAVLDLLDRFRAFFDGDLAATVEALHRNETELRAVVEEYVFSSQRMRGRMSDKDLDALRANIPALDEKIRSTKRSILVTLADFIARQDVAPQAGANDRLSLIRCLYRVLTSSIETLDAKSVQT
jgi:hypothetical protein